MHRTISVKSCRSYRSCASVSSPIGFGRNAGYHGRGVRCACMSRCRAVSAVEPATAAPGVAQEAEHTATIATACQRLFLSCPLPNPDDPFDRIQNTPRQKPINSPASRGFAGAQRPRVFPLGLSSCSTRPPASETPRNLTTSGDEYLEIAKEPPTPVRSVRRGIVGVRSARGGPERYGRSRKLFTCGLSGCERLPAGSSGEIRIPVAASPPMAL